MLLKWRNRPVARMDRADLQAALNDCVHELNWLRDQHRPNQFFKAFLSGLMVGSFCSIFAMTFAALVI